MYGPIKLFSGSSNPDLTEAIASHLGMEVGEAKLGRFSDGEIQVEINDNVRGRDVFLVQSTCSPSNDHIMELLNIGPHGCGAGCSMACGRWWPHAGDDSLRSRRDGSRWPNQ